jgi:hypothetical protein
LIPCIIHVQFVCLEICIIRPSKIRHVLYLWKKKNKSTVRRLQPFMAAVTPSKSPIWGHFKEMTIGEKKVIRCVFCHHTFWATVAQRCLASHADHSKSSLVLRVFVCWLERRKKAKPSTEVCRGRWGAPSPRARNGLSGGHRASRLRSFANLRSAVTCLVGRTRISMAIFHFTACTEHIHDSSDPAYFGGHMSGGERCAPRNSPYAIRQRRRPQHQLQYGEDFRRLKYV